MLMDTPKTPIYLVTPEAQNMSLLSLTTVSETWS